MKEISFGYFKKSLEKPKELFTFAFLTLKKQEKGKSKIYSKFQISEEGIKMLEYSTGKTGQTVGMSYIEEDDKFVIINSTDIASITDKGIHLLSKLGTFSYKDMYQRLIDKFQLNINKDNHFKLILTKEYKHGVNNLIAAELDLIDEAEEVASEEITDLEQEIQQDVQDSTSIIENEFLDNLDL